MKAKRVFKRALATAVALCAISGGYALTAANGVYAADGDPAYPSKFEHTLEFDTPLRDFAVNGDTYAFAYNTMITVLSKEDNDEIKRSDFMHESEISHLDYGDDGLYFQNTSQVTYLYGTPPTRAEHEFTNVSKAPDYTPLHISSSAYYTLLSNGNLKYFVSGEEQIVNGGEGNFTLVKKCGDVVYAIMDNAPYVVTGTALSPVPLTYTDFSAADNITVGGFKQALTALNSEITTAKLYGDRYYTQIDGDVIGDKFKQIVTKKTNGPKPCLLLAEDTGLAVVATVDGMFVTDPDNVYDRSSHMPTANDWKLNADGKRIGYAIEKVGVYASPVMCGGTKIADLEKGSAHPAEVLEKYTFDFLKTEFYKIKFDITDGDGQTVQTVIGYVAPQYLTEYNFAVDDNKPQESGDEKFDYDTNVASVVLAIVIVALVIIAVMYLSMISSKKGAGKKKKEKQKKAPPVEDVPDDSEE